MESGAAWVQAIGSVFAVFVAIIVAWWQSKQSRDLFKTQLFHEKEQVRLHRIASLQATVDSAAVVARRVIEVQRNLPTILLEGSASGHLEAMSVCVTWLSKLPVHELPGALVAREVNSIELSARRMLSVLEQVNSDGKLSVKSHESLVRMTSAVEDKMNEAVQFADCYDGDIHVIREKDF